MTQNAGKYYWILIGVILILLFPALLINLGLNPLIADEATRAVVSMEMDLSGNLITPTINGVPYFNKPPLYNWILLGMFKLTGNNSELIIRLPAVISLLLFGLLIWLSVKKKLGNRIAIASSLVFITSGRILFYDSMAGLIDLSYSAIIFLNFILIYHFIQKKKYYTLFLLSYLLASASFLMKGLPTVLFQGITLVIAFIYLDNWKKLFRIPHLAGLGLFILLVGTYYYSAWKLNPDSSYITTLVSESTKRTFVEHGWWKTIGHLFSFPPEQLLHLVPWSVFLIFLFQKSFYSRIRKDKFLSYLGLVFLGNIPVYWISVESYPRYIFMLYPLLLILIINQYYNSQPGNKLWKTSSLILFYGVILAIPIGSWIYFKHDFTYEFNKALIYIIFLLISFISLYFFHRKPGLRIEITLIFLLLLRIGFNFIILPERHAISRTVLQKEQAVKAAKLAKGCEIKTRPISPVSRESIYYMMRENNQIIHTHFGDPTPGSCYIFDDRDRPYPGEEVLMRFETRWENSPIRLSRIHEE